MKFFGKNMLNLRQKLLKKWKNDNKRHCHLFSKKNKSRHGRHYRMPIWVTRQSYELGVKTHKRQRTCKHGTDIELADDKEEGNASVICIPGPLSGAKVPGYNL